MRMRRHASTLGLALLLTAGSGAVSAQMSVPTGRDTLRGLPGVEVIVEAVPPELASRGLSTGDVTAAVTRRLEMAGIPVFASQAGNPSPAQPYLYVHLNALQLPDGGPLAVAVLVQVRQAVDSLASQSRIVDAVTWDAHNVLGVPAGSVPALQAEIEEYVDLFVADWRAVH